MELLEDTGELDLIVACVGGGGLISGCATVAAGQAVPPRVVGVEPEAGDDVRQSLERGQIVTIAKPRTIADGQQTTAPGKKTFAVMQEHVDAVGTVTAGAVVVSMPFAVERTTLVLEPRGRVPSTHSAPPSPPGRVPELG